MSDNDGEVREKLRKTSIEPTLAAAKLAKEDSAAPTSVPQERPRRLVPADSDDDSSDDDPEPGNVRKRSRSADDEDDDQTSGTRTKKRVPSNSSADEEKTTDAHMQALASPKGKRTREEFQRDNGSDEDDGRELPPDSPKKAIDADVDSDETRTVKRKREASLAADAPKPGEDAEKAKSPVKLPTGSGFGNVSAASPFASISSPAKKETKPETSSTSQAAFEASSFSKLAKSTTSPFGSIGTSTSASPFGGFGNTASTNPFASASGKPTGFGGLGVGGFAAAEGNSSPWAAAGSQPSLFGSSSSTSGKPPPITGLSSAPAKPFGAPEDEDDDDEDEDDEGSEDDDSEHEEDDENAEDETAQVAHPKASKVSTKSGEEEEFTVFTGRAKLYQFVNEWKEAGAGTLKLNVSREEDDPQDVGLETLFQDYEDDEDNLIVYANGEKKEESKTKRNHRKARFILRVDGSGRLVLNTALTPNMPFGGDAKGNEPKGQTLLFHGTLAAGEDGAHSGAVRSLQLKMKADKALELWSTVEVVKKAL